MNHNNGIHNNEYGGTLECFQSEKIIYAYIVLGSLPTLNIK